MIFACSQIVTNLPEKCTQYQMSVSDLIFSYLIFSQVGNLPFRLKNQRGNPQGYRGSGALNANSLVSKQLICLPFGYW
jgi:hypothetical protein